MSLFDDKRESVPDAPTGEDAGANSVPHRVAMSMPPGSPSSVGGGSPVESVFLTELQEIHAQMRLLNVSALGAIFLAGAILGVIVFAAGKLPKPVTDAVSEVAEAVSE